MVNIERYVYQLPSVPKLELTKHLFEQTSNEYNAVELCISLHQSAININELSSYLNLIYRIDGHLSEIGYVKYSHYPTIQIEIDEVRLGSWEIVIERFLNTIDTDKLAIIYLALKFLPNIAKTFGDIAYRYYEINDKREDYLEKKERRKQRKEIRELINQEFASSSLDKKSKEKLINILEELYQKCANKLASASRLAQKSINHVKLNPKTKKN